MANEEELTDWPPPDWRIKVEVKNGRKIKYYVNKKSGLRCFSKPAVLRFLRSEISSTGKSQLPSGHSKLSLGKEDDEGKPEWLPSGWTMEWEVRKSGRAKGSQYRCYMDPSTGQKFYSELEVSRYLKSKQQKASSSKQTKGGITNHTSSKGQGGLSSSSDSKPASEPKLTKREEIHNGRKVVIETMVDEDLPPGWLKEFRIKRVRGKIRKDTFYFNPMVDYEFISKVDALRYLESGKPSKNAKKRKNDSINEDKNGYKMMEQGVISSSDDKPASELKIMWVGSEPKIMRHEEIHKGEKVVIETMADEDLPPGWLKEIRTKRVNGEIRKDTLYFNPLVDYKFISKADTLRYLETGKPTKNAKKRKNDSINEDTNGCKHMEQGGISGSDHKPASEPKITRREEIHNGEKVIIETMADEDLPPGWLKEIRIKTIRGKIRKDPFYYNPMVDYIFISKVDALRYLETGKPPKNAKKRKNDSINRDTSGSNFMPPSLNKEKAAVDAVIKSLFAEPEDLENGHSEKPCGPLGDENEAATMQTQPAVVAEGRSTESVIGKDSVKSSQISNSKSRIQKLRKKAIAVPTRSSGRLAGVEAQPVFSSVPIVHTVRATRSASQKAKSVPSLAPMPHDSTGGTSEKLVIGITLEPPAPASPAACSSGDPVKKQPPSKQVKPQQNLNKKKSSSGIEKNVEEPVGLNVEPIQVLPVAEQPPASVNASGNGSDQFCCTAIWSDPCLEFAYKTLTGAIPLDPLDDNLAIQDYVDHQLRTGGQSNGNLGASDISSPSFATNDVPLRPDLMKPASVEPMQTEPVEPMQTEPVPPLGGGGHLPYAYGFNLPK